MELTLDAGHARGSRAGAGWREMPQGKWEGMTLEHVRAEGSKFAVARDWTQFHTPRNIMSALTSEVGEVVSFKPPCSHLVWCHEAFLHANRLADCTPVPRWIAVDSDRMPRKGGGGGGGDDSFCYSHPPEKDVLSVPVRFICADSDTSWSACIPFPTAHRGTRTVAGGWVWRKGPQCPRWDGCLPSMRCTVCHCLCSEHLCDMDDDAVCHTQRNTTWARRSPTAWCTCCALRT